MFANLGPIPKKGNQWYECVRFLKKELGWATVVFKSCIEEGALQ